MPCTGCFPPFCPAANPAKKPSNGGELPLNGVPSTTARRVQTGDEVVYLPDNAPPRPPGPGAPQHLKWHRPPGADHLFVWKPAGLATSGSGRLNLAAVLAHLGPRRHPRPSGRAHRPPSRCLALAAARSPPRPRHLWLGVHRPQLEDRPQHWAQPLPSNAFKKLPRPGGREPDRPGECRASSRGTSRTHTWNALGIGAPPCARNRHTASRAAHHRAHPSNPDGTAPCWATPSWVKTGTQLTNGRRPLRVQGHGLFLSAIRTCIPSWGARTASRNPRTLPRNSAHRLGQGRLRVRSSHGRLVAFVNQQAPSFCRPTRPGGLRARSWGCPHGL